MGFEVFRGLGVQVFLFFFFSGAWGSGVCSFRAFGLGIQGSRGLGFTVGVVWIAVEFE